MLEAGLGFAVKVDKGEFLGRDAVLKRKEKGSAGEIGVELEVRMIDENDILLVSDDEPGQNRKQAGYVNTGGMQQMEKLPGND